MGDDAYFAAVQVVPDKAQGLCDQGIHAHLAQFEVPGRRVIEHVPDHGFSADDGFFHFADNDIHLVVIPEEVFVETLDSHVQNGEGFLTSWATLAAICRGIGASRPGLIATASL